MKNRNQEAWILLLGGVLLVVLAIGQENRQEWALKPARSAGSVQFSIDIRKPGSQWITTTDVPLDRFRGLPADPFSRSGQTTFDYVQDAGRFVCKGSMAWNKGSGTFTFEPDPKFTAELQRMGYLAPDSWQVFEMMLAGVSLEFARVAKEAGVRSSTAQLLEMRHHGVSVEYMQAIKKAGYDKLRADDLMQMKDHGVSTDFMADLKDAGYELATDRMVQLHDRGVDSRYMAELKRHGLKPGVQEILQLRDHGVSPEYMKSLQDAGYEGVSAEDMTRMRDHGVPADFAVDARDLGYNFTLAELIQMKDNGVDSKYLRRLKDSGMRSLTAAQITKLKQHGVD